MRSDKLKPRMTYCLSEHKNGKSRIQQATAKIYTPYSNGGGGGGGNISMEKITKHAAWIFKTLSLKSCLFRIFF